MESKNKGIIHLRTSINCEFLPDNFCSAFSEFISMRGLKSLFFNSIMKEIARGTEDEIEVRRRLAEVLMGNFTIVFPDEQKKHDHENAKLSQNSQASSLPKQKTKFDEFRDELKEFSDQFAQAVEEG